LKKTFFRITNIEIIRNAAKCASWKLFGVIASEVNNKSIRTVDAQLNLAISNRTLMIRGNGKLFGIADSKCRGGGAF